MKTNVYGPLIAMQEAIPVMRAQGGGAIVNVSSIVSKSSLPYVGGYAATKYALNALSLTARNELEKDRITISLVHPGTTATDFSEHAYSMSEGLGQKVRASSPHIDSAHTHSPFPAPTM
jgi:NAD(P)-dependent dehydrogenase (short-subunit alcohol dehydrogenase family)